MTKIILIDFFFFFEGIVLIEFFCFDEIVLIELAKKKTWG